MDSPKQSENQLASTTSKKIQQPQMSKQINEVCDEIPFFRHIVSFIKNNDICEKLGCGRKRSFRSRDIENEEKAEDVPLFQSQKPNNKFKTPDFIEPSQKRQNQDSNENFIGYRHSRTLSPQKKYVFLAPNIEQTSAFYNINEKIQQQEQNLQFLKLQRDQKQSEIQSQILYNENPRIFNQIYAQKQSVGSSQIRQNVFYKQADIQSKSNYRNILNRLNGQKLFMNNYYSGPPKFQYNTNSNHEQLEKAIKLTKYETQKLVNLESQSNQLLNLISENSLQTTQNGHQTHKLSQTNNIKMKINPEMKEFIDQGSQYDIESKMNQHEKDLQEQHQQKKIFFSAPGKQTFNGKINLIQIPNNLEIVPVVAVEEKMVMKVETVKKEEKTVDMDLVQNIIKSQIIYENDQILSNQSAQKSIKNGKIACEMPQVSNQEKNLISLKSNIKQPDEDIREELNLPEINLILIKDQIIKNSEALAEIEQQNPNIIHKFTAKIRPALRFMQQPVQVWASTEITDESKWQIFIKDISWTISDRSSDKKVQAIFIIDQHQQSRNIDLIIIDSDKILKISFSTQKQATWTDSSAQDEVRSDTVLEKRIQNIFEMMNGKKFGPGKPKLMFGNFAKQVDAQDDGAIVQVPEPERVKEVVQVENPLFVVFEYYRYYVLQGKYKSIVKFNLEHARYYEKRDQFVEMADDESLRMYWQACFLSLICV